MRFFSFSPDLPIKFHACGQLVSPDGFLHMKRTMDQNVFIFVLEGSLFINSNGAEYTVSPGNFIILKSGEFHFGYKNSTGILRYMWAHFTAPYTLNISNSYPEDSIYHFPEFGAIHSPGRISQIFHQLADLSTDASQTSVLMKDYCISLLLLELTKDQSPQKNSCASIPPAISSVAEWICVNYYRSFTVSELANRFGYQADYLSSVFKKHMGVSISEYTNRIRIKASKTLLTDYDLKVKEAAYSCGFSDEKYFMKVFKKHEGVTPLVYKQSFARKLINE